LESSKNKEWKTIATNSIPERKKEFDSIDRSSQIPVLLTSELLYKALILPETSKYKAKEFYGVEAPIPISANYNLLNRPLLPLYRHYLYKLSEHNSYLNYLQSLFAHA
jgi:hypothetical protein